MLYGYHLDIFLLILTCYIKHTVTLRLITCARVGKNVRKVDYFYENRWSSSGPTQRSSIVSHQSFERSTLDDSCLFRDLHSLSLSALFPNQLLLTDNNTSLSLSQVYRKVSYLAWARLLSNNRPPKRFRSLQTRCDSSFTASMRMQLAPKKVKQNKREPNRKIQATRGGERAKWSYQNVRLGNVGLGRPSPKCQLIVAGRRVRK